MADQHYDDDDDAKDWERCSWWMTRCMVLATCDHNTMSVDNFAMQLRDGVLLCNLLNRLHPGAIDAKSFSQRPQMSQFLCLKNIRVFLQACKKVFGMKESALFDPSDLFDMGNFNKVVTALSTLSNTKEAKKSGIEPFSTENDEIYTIITSENIEDEYNIYDNTQEDADEEVYGRLIEYMPMNKSSAVSKSTVPLTQRDHCLNELIDTERNYVDVLNMIVQKFMEPLRNVMPISDSEVIFCHVKNLHKIHKEFLADIESCHRQSNGPTNTIPGCFIKWKMKFVIYGDYCSNLSSAHDSLEKCLQSTRIKEIVDKKNEEAKVRLRDLLTVPFQRILKYHLLVNELVKKTEQEHPEMPQLKDAMSEMQDLSMYVNEVKRDNENLDIIRQIETSIVDLKKYMQSNAQLRDYGRRLLDGELKVKGPRDNAFETRYMFLFDKVMLLCRPRGDSYCYKDVIVLSHFTLQDVPKDKTMFYFALNGIPEKSDSKDKKYTFGAKTEDLIRKWEDSIELAKSNFAPPGCTTPQHSFHMQTFNEPTRCDVCKKLLRGVFYQGYRCAMTGLSVHKECIMRTSENQRTVKGKVKAIMNYSGSPAPDTGKHPLTFDVNDVIEFFDDSDSYWMEGRFNGVIGFFPKEKVREMVPRRRDVPNYELPTSASSASSSASSLPQLPPRTSELRKPLAPNLRSQNRKSIFNPSEPNDQPWFAGTISRNVAGANLKTSPDGTFLVRFSPDKNEYALSVSYDSAVKHIRIIQDEMGYCLVIATAFRDIPELVEHYKTTSLQEHFAQIKTCLTKPYSANKEKEPGICTALYDYAATETNQLSFFANDKIAILSRTSGYQLWWKGKLNGRIGFFPSNYVTED